MEFFFCNYTKLSILVLYIEESQIISFAGATLYQMIVAIKKSLNINKLK